VFAYWLTRSVLCIIIIVTDSYPEVTAELQDKKELNALESKDKKPAGKGEGKTV